MPRYRVAVSIAWICAAALAAAVGGCKNSVQVFEDNNEGGWFSKKVDIFAKPEWSTFGDSKKASKTLEPEKAITADDLVGADGRCASAMPAVDPATTGAVDGQPGAANPADMQQPAVQPALGGIALGMSECDAVRRAGIPTQLNISSGQSGERLAVLTYAPGSPWPGIYKFSDGRLREIERVAEPEQPKELPKKKGKKPVKPKTAAKPGTRSSVQ